MVFNKHYNQTVSVIMPAYKCQDYIGDSIDSVLNQTYENIQLIVVLDGEDEFVRKIVTKYCNKDPRVLMISHETNIGIAAARNTGLKNACGELIAFCDSDDIWMPFKLEMQLELMATNGLSISHASAVVINSCGDEMGFRLLPTMVDFAMMKKRNYIINSSAVFLRDDFPKIYQSQVRHEDYDFWLRLFANGAVSISYDKPLIKYRVHSKSVTSNKLKSLVWMCQIQRKHGISWVKIFVNIMQNSTTRLVEYVQIWAAKLKQLK